MYIKIVINFFLLLLLLILQISFVHNFFWWFADINIVIVALIFILSIHGFEKTIWWFLGAGAVLDIFSFSYFGVYIISLAIVSIFADLLLKSYLTNKSIYSFLALGALVSALFSLVSNVLIYLINYFGYGISFFMKNNSFWLNSFHSLVANLMLIVVVFYIVNFVSLKLKPVFLIKRK